MTDFLYGFLITLLGMIMVVFTIVIWVAPIVLAIVFFHWAWLLLYFIIIPITGGLVESGLF